MTPLSRPPYPMTALLRALTRRAAALPLREVEAAYAEALGVSDAVLFPSCRSAIGVALLSAGAPAVASAFTCATVWQAARFARAPLTILDTAADGFLMSAESVRAAAPGAALILSEVFGYTYELAALPTVGPNGPALRIVDMAMSVPSRERLSALASADVATLSFGSRKCLSAGWGGMVLTRDPDRAARLRELRAERMHPAARRESRRRAARLIGVQLTRGPLVYGALATWRRLPRRTGPVQAAVAAGGALPADVFGEDWSSLPTAFERDLMLRNLARLDELAARRRRLAGVYRQELSGVGWITLPPPANEPLSHFTIRVSAELREPLRAWLAAGGIETGRLFFFSQRLAPADHPHARRLSDEVVNLPLDPRLTEACVAGISRRVAAFSPSRAGDGVGAVGVARAEAMP